MSRTRAASSPAPVTPAPGAAARGRAGRVPAASAPACRAAAAGVAAEAAGVGVAAATAEGATAADAPAAAAGLARQERGPDAPPPAGRPRRLRARRAGAHAAAGDRGAPARRRRAEDVRPHTRGQGPRPVGLRGLAVPRRRHHLPHQLPGPPRPGVPGHPSLAQGAVRRRAGALRPRRHPLGRGHGRCAEVSLVSDRLHELGRTRDISSLDDARDALAGSKIHTVAIGEQFDNDGNKVAHGGYLPPCRSCGPVMDALGVGLHS
ncbi:YwqJ-related putative deaminase [Streptomyces zhihengii]